MDIAAHAQLMAANCDHAFAELIYRVPSHFAGQDELALRLISLVRHASGMAKSERAGMLMYCVAEKAFNAASADHFDVQNEAAKTMIRAISHANLMGNTASEAANDMLDAVQLLVDQPLPTNHAQLKELLARDSLVRAQIAELSHKALMARRK